MEETDLQHLSGDSFILIVNIFDENSVKDATNAFVKKIIDALPFIVDEGTLNALISILACVCPTFEKRDPDNNIITKEFTKPEKENFYKEKLLFLANRGAVYRLDKLLQTISVLLCNPKTVKMFNENDVDFIVDVTIREMGVRNNHRTRCEILKVINIIFDHQTYWKYYS